MEKESNGLRKMEFQLKTKVMIKLDNDDLNNLNSHILML